MTIRYNACTVNCSEIARAQNGGVAILRVANVECEGKESSNYTFVRVSNLDSNCDADSAVPGIRYLIASSSSGQKTVNTLALLANSEYPNGG